MLNKAVLIATAILLYSCVSSPQQSPENTRNQEIGFDTWGRGSDPWLSDWERTQKKQAQRNKEIMKGSKQK